MEPGFRAHQDQVAIVAPDPTQGADHGSQAGGVDEVDGGKVEHEPGVASGDQLRHLLAEPGGAGHVKVASEHQNGPWIPRDAMELEVHVDPSASVLHDGRGPRYRTGAPARSHTRRPSRLAPMEAAFFDLDRTVIARASLAAYGPVLRKEGYLSVPMALRAAWGQVVYRFFGADDESIDRARRTALRLAAGWEQDGLRRIARDHLAEVIEPIVYDEALELIDQHREEGRLVVLVSAAPVEIVEPLATHLGIDEFVATTPEVDPEGRYTGEVEFSAHGEGKAEAMSRLAEDRGLDLGASWAYSDSVSDLPMLEAVGNPVVVNPDRQLRRLAEDRGWPVLEFDRPVALGERIPLDRRWGAVTALTLVLALVVWAGVRRARRGSRAMAAGGSGVRSSGPS